MLQANYAGTASYAPPMGQQQAVTYTPTVQQQAGTLIYEQAVQQQQPVPYMKQQQAFTYAAAPTVQQGFANPEIFVQPTAEAVIKMEVGLWQVCEDQQGEFYVHTASGQQFDQPPYEVLQVLQQVQAPGPMNQQIITQQPQETQAMVKTEVGAWQICEDAQGEYYVHKVSGQTFDQPPVELLQLLQQFGV